MIIAPFLRRAEISSCKGKENGVGLMEFVGGMCVNSMAYPHSMIVRTHLSDVILFHWGRNRGSLVEIPGQLRIGRTLVLGFPKGLSGALILLLLRLHRGGLKQLVGTVMVLLTAVPVACWGSCW